MTFVMIDDMRMYYTEHGNPDNPPLLLLHVLPATAIFG